MASMRSTTSRNRPVAAMPDPLASCGPVIFDLSVDAGRVAFDALRTSGRVARSTDLLPRQVAELAGIWTSGRSGGSVTIERGMGAVVGGDPASLGCWVFYPWSGHLVHMLPRDLWAALRADRNRYKLTAAEQQRLASATVAVAGLSVGASVVQVLALEGCGGVLKLADPDTLDGSNCNRLRGAMWDLGQPKAVLAARMVWEIDPFRRVEVIPEGVTSDTVAGFLDGVDVVVEECDSFAMKVLIRLEARRRRLPVVMATAEGGMLDIERFDLEPTRPLFHGLAPGIESEDLSAASCEDRVRLALRIIGVEHVSDRAAASMIEIGRTLSSWPQLAGEVVSGGAHAAVAVRRILLGLPCPAGRYRLDIDRLLACGGLTTNGCGTPSRPALHRTPPSRSRSDGFIEEIVAAATSAPSAGNSQPWRFSWDGCRLGVRLDRVRARTAIDPRCAAGWIALGAACENIAIASSHHGRPGTFNWFPDSADRNLAAMVTFPSTPGASAPDCSRLFPVIAERRTDRTVGSAGALSSSERRALVDAAAVHGAALQVVEDQSGLARFATVLGTSDRVRLLNPTLHRELAGELRWSGPSAHAAADGIEVASLAVEPSGLAALRLLMRPAVSRFLAQHNLGSRLAEIQRCALMATSALALVTVAAGTPVHLLRGGRAMQRVWLEATAHRLAVHPVTPLTLFGLLEDGGTCLSDADRRELQGIARELGALFAIGDGVPILIIRLHRGSGVAPARAGRRPVDEVLHTMKEAA